MNPIVKKYFDKGPFLTVKNKVYAETCLQLFDFQIQNDLVENDITLKIISGKYNDATANIISKQSGVIAGIEEVIFLINRRTNLKVKQNIKDGTEIKDKDLLIMLTGNPLEILKYERTILNILQRMSGLATLTNSLIIKNNLKTPLAATRKTLWGLLDKKAVFTGGGLTHRLSLSDEILIKDNHIELWAKKFGVSRLKSLKMILDFIKNNQVKNPFEIEVTTEKEAYFLNNYYQEINISAPLIIMLDNFKPVDAVRTIKVIREHKNSPKVIFELSGGINENNVKLYDELGADVISLGALTHSPKALDISLQLE
ncbi:Nicotinate-nucleotide diphosphorylase (Carboxylating) [Candidatus Roizmanbacteria bacterium]|nr:Nicotinate-nucleotide diphosphorylase (Carboxylating) [Candidatus Roizmanbacteria bacterium]